MVRMKLLSGPYKGRVRDVSNQNSQEMLTSVFQHGWSWEIDYSHATSSEKYEWGRWDMVFRILRALKNGKTVEFMGKTYQAQSAADLPEVAQEIEDAITSSGRMVTVDQDDENGVLIGAYQSLN